MGEQIRARCPLCGMICDEENLDQDEPYPFEVFLEEFGGKMPVTEEDREARKGKGFRSGKGSSKGRIVYTKLTGQQHDQVWEKMKRRIEKLV